MHMPERGREQRGGFHPEPATASTLTRGPAPAPTAGAAAIREGADRDEIGYGSLPPHYHR